jgi:hypothetical protein
MNQEAATQAASFMLGFVSAVEKAQGQETADPQ